jgi:outer membrane receptor protein involved in Fe transport
VLWAKPMPGLSLRVSGFYWDARGIITAEPFTDPNTGMDLQRFENAGRLVTGGVEVEGSYRDASGWYVFGGGAVSEVGTDVGGQIEYGNVPDAAKYTAAGGVSTPLINGKAHVSTELLFVGSRPTRTNTDTGEPESEAPAWLGWNATVYVPNVRGVDVTIGVRNIIGKREYVVAPGDYDRARPDMSTITIPRLPGEGRELYAKVGYRF